MVESGRTRAVQEELDSWYDKYAGQEIDWESDCMKKTLNEFLDTRNIVPFRAFMVRYLIAAYGEDFCPVLFPELSRAEWNTVGVEKILEEMSKSESLDYSESPKLLQQLTDLVFDQFVVNHFYSSKSKYKEAPSKVLGYVTRKGPLWDKNILLKKLEAVRGEADSESSDLGITDDEFWVFAFGLNMDYRDIKFFMTKALKRSTFNFWNWQEFLLYVTYRYARGNTYQFYLKLKEAYLDKKVKPEKIEESEKNIANTQSVQGKLDDIFEKIEETEGAIALDEDGNLPPYILECVSKYKAFLSISDDYTRTATKICQELLQKFGKRIEIELISREICDGGKDINKQKAQGKVTVYYELNMGVEIPKGTIFTKIDKKLNERIDFVTLDEVKIAPASEKEEDIIIEVCCTKKEKKEDSPEKQYAYIPGKTEFTSDNRNLSEITNKSYFKPATKKAVGEEICISGKLSAKCKTGKTVPKGTKFYALNAKGERVTFVSTKDAGAPVCVEICVESVNEGSENIATKNEITECSIRNWKQKFVKIENKIISIKDVKREKKEEDAKSEHVKREKKEEDAKSEHVYNYLYKIEEVEEILDKKYVSKLGEILEGTRLSESKIYSILKGKKYTITRNDVLTICFLEHMSGYEETYLRQGKYYAINSYTVFLQKTNEVLRKCGFYELYEPNLYDSFLMYLTASSEGIASYRNIWSWYLRNK